MMTNTTPDLDRRPTELTHFDPWLSEFLGREAYHLNVQQAFGSHAPGDSEFTLRELLAAPAFVDAKVDSEDVTTLNALAALGFWVVDVNIQLLRPCAPWADVDLAVEIRVAEPSDEVEVGSLAGRVFRYDRFHADPAIPNETANAIKSAWARNFFSGQRGDRMVVAEDTGEVVGFLQLIRRRNDTLVIDLIGVDAHLEGRGLARAMITHAARAYAPQADIIVGTQISNIKSLRLYEGLGFRTTASVYVLHHHGMSTKER